MARKRWIRVEAREKAEPDKAQLSLLDPPPEPVRRRARRQGGASVGGLLTPPDELLGEVRNPDYPTSIAAAEKARAAGRRLHSEILRAFEIHGPMNDGELETLPELAWVAVSNSIRRTRTTLLKEGILEDSGEKRGHPLRPRSMMVVWRRKVS